MSAPGILDHVKVASDKFTSKNAKSQAHTLQATPTSSNSCHDAFAVGSVYRIASKGSVKRSRGLATYVTRTGGVVVVDLSSQATTFSSTFSASARPFTPPLVLHDGLHQAAFVALWPRIAEQSGELHVWSEARDASLSATSSLQHHHQCPIARDVTSLHPISATEILACHENGRFSVISFGSLRKPELAASNPTTGTAKDSARRSLFIGLLDRNAASSTLGEASAGQQSLVVHVSAPTASAAPSAVRSPRKGRKSAIDVIDAAEGRVAANAGSSSVTVTYYAVDEAEKQSGEGRIREIGTAEVQGTGSSDNATSARFSASLDASGQLVLLSHDGHLTSYVLSSTPTGEPRVEARGQLKTRINSPSAVLAVSPSTVLVASQDSSSRISALLLDMQLGSVLAEHAWTPPTEESEGSMLFLHGLGGSSALLLMASSTQNGARGSALLWHVPFQTGDGSHLRWALLSRDLTRKWIESETASDSITSSDDKATRGRADLLRDLEKHANSSGDAKTRSLAMDKAFHGWHEKLGLNSMEDVEMSTADQSSGKANGTGIISSLQLRLPQAFVTALTALAMPAASSTEMKSAVYARSIVHFLLQHKVLRNAAVPSHFPLAYMREAGDWTAVRLAFRLVDDISADDVAELIRSAATATEGATNDSKSAMSLEAVLVAAVDTTLSPAEMRRAFKDKLDIAHIDAILAVLVRWLEPDKGQPMLPSPEGEQSVDEKGRPPLVGALSFAINMLDAFFPVMLATPSMQQPLAELSHAVQAHLASIRQLGMLRGSMAAFAKLDEDRAREADAQLAERMGRLHAADAEGDRLWSTKGRDALGGRARKPRDGDAGATVQVGGGALNRAGVQEKTRRQQTYAESMAVGLYALEHFVP